MLFTDIILGTIVGAILWPIIQQVVDSTNRAVLGLIIGGMIGGAVSWARLGLYASQIIGASIGADIEPTDVNLGIVFVNALIQTVRGGAIGTVVALSIRSFSFVLTGAGIGLIFSLVCSLALRFLNQEFLSSALTSTHLTAAVFTFTLFFFGFLSSRERS
jgi:hypothetical protein